MAEVPAEAVEFARVLVRAFYPPDYVVACDGVLRRNNYVAHGQLASQLKIAPKELRITLVKMVQARLMKSEKRQQKRVNVMEDRRASRTVSTEFWYVPLREVVDAFVYRMDRITLTLNSTAASHATNRLHRCQRCGWEYKEIDLVSRITEDGFICDRYGVTVGRRPTECGGCIKEEDTTVIQQQSETLHRSFTTQLKPLCERARSCMQLSIPAHPLDGADDATWGALVPETIGLHGEVVDEDGLTPEMAARMGKTPTVKREELRKPLPIPVKPLDNDTPIPEKPSWFKEKGTKDEDNDDDWDDETTRQNVLMNANGTAASFGGEADANTYYQQFLRAAGGLGEQAGQSEAVQDKAKAVANDASQHNKYIDSKSENVDAVPEEDEDAPADTGADDVFVKVAGRSVRMSEVTEEMQEEMTPEEFKEFHALGQRGGDDDDDDEDYE